jgi:hypothetical protein
MIRLNIKIKGKGGHVEMFSILAEAAVELGKLSRVTLRER